MRLARWACPAFFDLLPLTPTWSPRAYLGARGAQSAQPPCQSQPSQGGDASRPKGGWLGFWVSCWVLWGEGQAPIQWDSETLRCSTVSHCVMTCVCVPCVCVCVCARARACVLMHGPVVALGMSYCPRRAPACSLPGSGEMAIPGRPGVQSRVGSCPLGLLAAHSFPQCLAMPGCPGRGGGW